MVNSFLTSTGWALMSSLDPEDPEGDPDEDPEGSSQLSWAAGWPPVAAQRICNIKN